MKALHFLFSCMLVFSCFGLNAQSSSGTEFWCAFQENLNPAFNDDPVFSFQISSASNTSGTVEVPLAGLSIPFSVLAGETIEVDLPTTNPWNSFGSETIEELGIKISSIDPITVRAIHYRLYFSESSMVLPTSELGEEYLVMCALDDDIQVYDPSEFVIVSPSDGNLIEITPSGETLGLQAAGVPFTLTLNAGETYQVQSLEDLTGSRILSLSGNPFAVFSGARQGNIGNCNADSHMYDQCIKLEDWSNSYFFVPFKNQGVQVVKILAAQDNTIVYCGCIQIAILNEGEFFSGEFSQAKVFTSNNPIAVSQISRGADCNPSGLGDPNILHLLPAKFQAYEVLFDSPGNINTAQNQTYFSTHGISIVARTDQLADITLDGNPISNEFQVFPEQSNYSYLAKSVTDGQHILSSSNRFWSNAYGFGAYDAYTHNLAYSSSANVFLNIPESLSLAYSGTLCVDSLISFSANTAILESDASNIQWTFSDSQTSTDWSPNLSFATGTYTANLSFTAFGCFYQSNINFEIESCFVDLCQNLDSLSIEFSGDLCIDSTLTFIPICSTSLTNFQWLGNSLTGSTENFSLSFPDEQNYTISLSAEDENECIYTAEIDVVIEDCSPIDCSNLDPLSINWQGNACIDSVNTFTAVCNTILQNHQWTVNGIVSNGATLTTTFTQSQLYTINLTAEDGLGCIYTSSFDLFVFDCDVVDCSNLLPIEIVLEGPLCIDSTLTFSVSSSANLQNYNWSLDNQSVGNDSTFITIYEEEINNTIQINAQDENSCNYTASLSFSIEDCSALNPCDSTVVLSINGNDTVCSDYTIPFSVSGISNIISQNWLVNNELASTELNPEFLFAAEGTFIVEAEVEDDLGCKYNASKEIIAINCDSLSTTACPVIFPSAFSPNGDEINDGFRGYSDCTPSSYSLKIYNRWGQLVFISNNPSEAWQGNFKDSGNPCGIGVYLFIAEFGSGNPENPLAVERGNISLIR